MVTKPRRISFDDFARTLERVFDEMAEQQQPVIVERGGRLYRVEPAGMHLSEDPWAKYDPDEARRALEASIGALAGVDTEQLKADIKAERGQDSPGRLGE
jgi:hypothetical protein